jgi:hypothetical protein
MTTVWARWFRRSKPASGSRLGVCTERSVDACDLQVTQAGLPTSVSQGADVAESRVACSNNLCDAVRELYSLESSDRTPLDKWYQ